MHLIRNVTIVIRHWLPIITFCPVNHLPDFIYVSVSYDLTDKHEPPELYGVRAKLRFNLSWRKCFMEDIAKHALAMFPDCSAVTVNLLFNRHQITIRNIK